MKLEFENINNNREDATTGVEEESMESSKKYIKNKTRRQSYKQNLSQNF